MTTRIIHGDCREVLAGMAAASVHCCVTSPPYWGLRDYGVEPTIWGGDPACEHDFNEEQVEREIRTGLGLAALGERYRGGGHKQGSIEKFTITRGFCSGCSAWRGTLGLEPTYQLYVEHMVEVFREVRRVLRDDGTLWLNLGDSYASSPPGNKTKGVSASSTLHGATSDAYRSTLEQSVAQKRNTVAGGLKPKDLAGIPWKVAQALQAPYYTGRIRSVEDRVWLAAMIDAEGCMFIHRRKAGSSAHTYYRKSDGTEMDYKRTQDTYGVGLEVSNTSERIIHRCIEIAGKGSICSQGPEQNGRRKQLLYRWNMRTNECRDIIREIYPHLVAKQQQARIVLGCPPSGDKAAEAHQALIGLHNGVATRLDFPEPESMFEPGLYLRQDIIWAKKNCMPESVRDRCCKSHEYMFLLTKSARYYFDADAIKETGSDNSHGGAPNRGGHKQEALGQNHGGNLGVPGRRNKRSVWTITTQPYSEAHFATFPPALVEPCIMAGCPTGGLVLDPFGGSGTVGMVADRLKRDSVLIELNPEYVRLMRDRMSKDAGMFSDVREGASA